MSTTEAAIPAVRALRALDWYQFEKLIALLFEHEGFSVQRGGGVRADGGIDLVATKEGITFGVQCKHAKSWQSGVNEIRAFFGALQDRKLRHGFLITLEGYTTEAAEFAQLNGLDLMDEAVLLENLEAVNWRASFPFLRLLHDKRKMCPRCESEMILRTAKNDDHPGEQFWGCSAHPRCSYTMAVRRDLEVAR